MENTEKSIRSPLVAFSTKCWENDWTILLNKNFLTEIIKKNDFNFDERILIINNVKNKDKVRGFAEESKNNKIIDNYFFIEEYVEQVLKYFNISRESFIEGGKDGYLYSICELFEIFYLKTDYLVHSSGDTVLEKKYNWVEEALKIFDSNENIVVVNPCWNRKYHEAKEESFKEEENYYLSEGYFSDQCYMIKLSEFKKQIYNEVHPFSERYPKYAGNLFEKRVDAWMRNHKKIRATLKNVSYFHRNWTVFNKFRYQLLKKTF